MSAARVARLVALVVLLTTFLPSASVYAQAGVAQVNVANPDFEGDAHGVGCCSNVANDWTHFYRIHEDGKHPAWQYHEPQYGNNRNDRRRNGNGSMSWGKDYATYDAGIWQRVTLPQGTGKITLTAWMTSWSGEGNNWGDNPQADTGKLIGIDPTGNTDVWASTVVWSQENKAKVDWVQLTVSAQAQGTAATIYLRSRNDLAMHRNATFVDEVRMTMETAPPPPPPPPQPVNDQPQDERYFFQTGYRISDDAFWNYFQRRGGVRTFGYPVSRTFRLLGSDVQIFQRRIMQKQANGQVGLLNVLDQDFMPYNSFNNAQIPAFDPGLVGTAPAPNAPNYGQAILEYVRRAAPDNVGGAQVNFYSTFNNAVLPNEVFVGVPVQPGILPGIDLELWGVPTSQPMADPKNANFIYQRWQRGVMHYDRTTGATQGLLLADYFKAIITGQNLPPDVAEAAKASRFYAQYNQSAPNGLARPEALPDTNMANAFVPGPTR